MFRRKQFDVTVFKEKIGIWEKKKTLNLMFRRNEFNVTVF